LRRERKRGSCSARRRFCYSGGRRLINFYFDKWRICWLGAAAGRGVTQGTIFLLWLKQKDLAMSFRSNICTASFTSQVARVAALLAVLSLTSTAHAVTLYWDANGSLAGTGPWDLVTANWNPTTTASDANVTWNPNDGTLDASFGGDPGAGSPGSGLGGPNGQVTVSGTVNVRSLIMDATAGNYSLSGGAINISDPANSIVMNTNNGSPRAQIIASPISGTDITVVVPNAAGTANSFLTLGAPSSGATNTFTGDLIFGGPNTAGGFSQININNPTALPPTATVRMRRNLCQLLFTGGGVSGTTGYTATFNNDIVLNDVGEGMLLQDMGASAADALISPGRRGTWCVWE
jgi:hypothetical protein